MGLGTNELLDTLHIKAPLPFRDSGFRETRQLVIKKREAAPEMSAEESDMSTFLVNRDGIQPGEEHDGECDE